MPGQNQQTGEVPSQQELWDMFLDQQKKFQKFQDYVAENMVPIKELVLGPKRLSQRESWRSKDTPEPTRMPLIKRR